MSAETWLLLSLTLFAGAASPGPSLALVVRTALAHGRLAGVTVALAHGVGVAIYALAVVFGVSGLVTQVDGAMLVIQILGVSFIIYLGAKMLRAGLKGLMAGDTDPRISDNEYSGKVTAVVHARNGLLIVILNPNQETTISAKTHHSRAEFNVFEGITVSGSPEFVICAGKIVVAEGQTNSSPGSAEYIPNSSHPPVVYDKLPEPQQPRKVDRGAVASCDNMDGGHDNGHGSNAEFGLTCPRGYRGAQVLNKQLGIYQRPLSAHGIRNQNDSTFSLNG